jgi:hypothetical protein
MPLEVLSAQVPMVEAQQLGGSGGSRLARNESFIDFGQHPVFGIITFLEDNRRPSNFSPTGSAQGSLRTADPFQLQSRKQSRGHTVFQFRPAKETSSLPRRALLMGGFAGAVSCASHLDTIAFALHKAMGAPHGSSRPGMPGPPTAVETSHQLRGK